MGELAGIIEAAIEQARRAQARAAAQRTGQPLPEAAPRRVVRQGARPGALAPPVAPRPAPVPVPELPALASPHPAEPPPAALLFPFRDRNALLASIVFSEALAPPLALQPRKLPSW